MGAAGTAASTRSAGTAGSTEATRADARSDSLTAKRAFAEAPEAASAARAGRGGLRRCRSHWFYRRSSGHRSGTGLSKARQRALSGIFAPTSAATSAAASGAEGIPFAICASSRSRRSARASRVRSASGRARRVSAISNTSRISAAERISSAASSSTTSTRDSRSPLSNSAASSASAAISSGVPSISSGRAPATWGHVHVADVRHEVARELHQVLAGVDLFFYECEERGDVARSERMAEAREHRTRNLAQQRPRIRRAHRTVAEHRKLLQRGERVAHAAARVLGYDLKGVVVKRESLLLADEAQTPHNILVADAMEVEALTTRENRLGDLLGIGGAQHEDHMRGRPPRGS